MLSLLQVLNTDPTRFLIVSVSYDSLPTQPDYVIVNTVFLPASAQVGTTTDPTDTVRKILLIFRTRMPRY